MPLIQLPHGDFFDSVEPLDTQFEKAQDLFAPFHALSTTLPALLMWQDEFAYALAQKNGFHFILALYGKSVYLPLPPHPFNAQSLGIAFDYLKQVNGSGPGVSRVEGLSAEQKEQALEWGYPIHPTLTEYIYDRSLIAGLHGDPYRAKRAEINHFLKENTVLLRPYRKSDLSACGELFELWKGQRLPVFKGEMGEKMILSSQKAHLRALTQGEDWGLDAWVVLIGQKLVAYTLGGSVNPTTYGIYMEVTDLTVKGLSAYIFTNICRQVEAYPLINAGDAEGLPRLAEAKEHWHPVKKQTLYAADPR